MYSIAAELIRDRARRARHLSANAMCTFNCVSTDPNISGGLLANPDIVIPALGDRQPSWSRSPNPDSVSRPSGVQADSVDFGQYVDEASSITDRIWMKLTNRRL